MNRLNHAQVRKRLLAEFGPDLLTLLETVAIEMGDEMAYCLALQIRMRLRAAQGVSVIEVGNNGYR